MFLSYLVIEFNSLQLKCVYIGKPDNFFLSMLLLDNINELLFFSVPLQHKYITLVAHLQTTWNNMTDQTGFGVCGALKV